MPLSAFSKTILSSSALLLALAAVIVLSVGFGTTGFDFDAILTVVGRGAHPPQTHTIVMEYRLPRTLLAAVAGAGLACAGVVFQAVLRNPLADPYLIGISGGGSLGAVVCITIFGQSRILGLSGMAFVGSLIAVGLVYGLASLKKGAGYINTIILAGVIVGALMNALMLLIISLSGSDEMQRILFWLMGDFSLADYRKTTMAGAVTCLGWLAVFSQANRLNLLMVGDESAAHLGLEVSKIRTFFIVVASLVTGTIVSVSGTVGFVGLIVPHMLRLAVGPDNRVLLPASLLGGAAFLAASDCIARLVAYPTELPVGVITALVGAPFFLYLLLRR
ncbi:MAG: FecCD family ABC transporter permease [Desulfomonilaceae bacterium]